jgi:hypothetical protein
LGAVFFGDFHFGHESGGYGVLVLEEVAPVETVELDGLEVEVEDF